MNINPCSWGINNQFVISICNILSLLGQLFSEISLLSAHLLGWVGIEITPNVSSIINILIGLFIIYKIVGYLKISVKLGIIVGTAYIAMNLLGLSNIYGNPSYILIFIGIMIFVILFLRK